MAGKTGFGREAENFSPPPTPGKKISKLSLALQAWNQSQKVIVPNIEVFSKLISSSKPVGLWYKTWSEAYSISTQKPESFKEMGVSDSEWKAIQEKLPQINALRKAHSEKVTEKADEFTTWLKSAERILDTRLGDLETPHIKILKVNVGCLPVEEQLQIITTPEDSRETVEKSLIHKFQVKLLKDLAAGQFLDPFKATSPEKSSGG